MKIKVSRSKGRTKGAGRTQRPEGSKKRVNGGYIETRKPRSTKNYYCATNPLSIGSVLDKGVDSSKKAGIYLDETPERAKSRFNAFSDNSVVLKIDGDLLDPNSLQKTSSGDAYFYTCRIPSHAIEIEPSAGGVDWSILDQRGD